MPSYSETHDVSRPAGNRAASLGDDDIRQYKREMDERLNEDHVKPQDETGEDNVGYHRKCQLVRQTSTPGNVALTGIVYTKDMGSGVIECFYEDAAGNEIQITTAGKINAPSIGGVYPASNLASVANILNYVYPIGAVVTLGVSTNPATLFGIGTWTAIAGKVIIGLNASDSEFDTLDETGGSKTVDSSHTHSVTIPYNGYANSTSSAAIDQLSTTSQSSLDGKVTEDRVVTSASGGSSTLSVLPPYITKYVWQRTA